MGNEKLRVTCRKVSGAFQTVHDVVVLRSVELETQLESYEEFIKSGGSFLMEYLEQDLVVQEGRERVRRKIQNDRNYPYWYRDILQFGMELTQQEDGTEQWVGKGISIRASFLGRIKVDLTCQGGWKSLGCFLDNFAEGYDGKPIEDMSLDEKIQCARMFAQPVAVSLLPHLEETQYK